MRYFCRRLLGLSGMVISSNCIANKPFRTWSLNLVRFVRPANVNMATMGCSVWHRRRISTWSRLSPDLVPSWSRLSAVLASTRPAVGAYSGFRGKLMVKMPSVSIFTSGHPALLTASLMRRIPVPIFSMNSQRSIRLAISGLRRTLRSPN